MITIIKNLERTVLKLRIIIAPLIVLCTANIQAQDTITSTPAIETQADKDWKALKSSLGNLGGGYLAVTKKNVLEKYKYEDKVFKKSSLLAKKFWDNYPEDSRRDGAMYRFFSIWANPHFISEKISDSLRNLLTSLHRDKRRRHLLRLMDDDARNQWLKAGDAMAASVLNSDASLERKERAEFIQIGREYQYAKKVDSYLTKAPSERAYWNRFEVQYWKHIRLCLENHVNKYAALEVVADRVQNILNLLKSFSPVATDAYWNYFYEISGSDHPLSDQAGIKLYIK